MHMWIRKWFKIVLEVSLILCGHLWIILICYFILKYILYSLHIKGTESWYFLVKAVSIKQSPSLKYTLKYFRFLVSNPLIYLDLEPILRFGRYVQFQSVFSVNMPSTILVFFQQNAQVCVSYPPPKKNALFHFCFDQKIYLIPHT
jgi:hypothetical protein